MSHDNHTTSSAHKELDALGRPGLLKLTAGWQDPFPKPIVTPVELTDGRTIRVVRDDLMAFGTKIRAGAAAFHNPVYKAASTIVYVAPRAGWAPISLALLCNQMGKRLVLFCPAAAEMSHHQKVAHALGADMRFVRIAAMPVLQGYARQWAEDHGYVFFPLGLAVPEAVSGIARVAMGLNLKSVQECWTVFSTGVLSRGLQVAWPEAEHYGVAVARNIQDGEKGIANLFSHPRAFLQDAPKDERPPFPSVPNYDAKAWIFIVSNALDGAVFWNVAGEIEVPPTTRKLPNSKRVWGDLSDLKKEKKK